MGDQPAGAGRRDHCIAPVHRADRGEHLLRWCILEHEAAGTGLDRLEHVLVQVERGEDDHPWGLADAASSGIGELGGGSETVHHRHPDIHQHHVHRMGGQQPQCLRAITGLEDHFHIRLGVDHQSEAGSDQLLVVHQGDSDRTVGGRCFGGHRRG